MTVSVSGSCSHTVDPVTHQNVYDSTFGIQISIPHFGNVFSLELDRHSGPDGRSLNETISLGIGANAHTYQLSFSTPPSSVIGGLAPLPSVLNHGADQLLPPTPVLPPVVQVALSNSPSNGENPHLATPLDLHDGTLISLPHAWHH